MATPVALSRAPGLRVGLLPPPACPVRFARPCVPRGLISRVPLSGERIAGRHCLYRGLRLTWDSCGYWGVNDFCRTYTPHAHEKGTRAHEGRICAAGGGRRRGGCAQQEKGGRTGGKDGLKAGKGKGEGRYRGGGAAERQTLRGLITLERELEGGRQGEVAQGAAEGDGRRGGQGGKKWKRRVVLLRCDLSDLVERGVVGKAEEGEGKGEGGGEGEGEGEECEVRSVGSLRLMLHEWARKYALVVVVAGEWAPDMASQPAVAALLSTACGLPQSQPVQVAPLHFAPLVSPPPPTTPTTTTQPATTSNPPSRPRHSPPLTPPPPRVLLLPNLRHVSSTDAANSPTLATTLAGVAEEPESAAAHQELQSPAALSSSAPPSLSTANIRTSSVPLVDLVVLDAPSACHRVLASCVGVAAVVGRAVAGLRVERELMGVLGGLREVGEVGEVREVGDVGDVGDVGVLGLMGRGEAGEVSGGEGRSSVVTVVGAASMGRSGALIRALLPRCHALVLSGPGLPALLAAAAFSGQSRPSGASSGPDGCEFHLTRLREFPALATLHCNETQEKDKAAESEEAATADKVPHTLISSLLSALPRPSPQALAEASVFLSSLPTTLLSRLVLPVAVRAVPATHGTTTPTHSHQLPNHHQQQQQQVELCTSSIEDIARLCAALNCQTVFWAGAISLQATRETPASQQSTHASMRGVHAAEQGSHALLCADSALLSLLTSAPTSESSSASSDLCVGMGGMDTAGQMRRPQLIVAGRQLQQLLGRQLWQHVKMAGREGWRDGEGEGEGGRECVVVNGGTALLRGLQGMPLPGVDCLDFVPLPPPDWSTVFLDPSLPLTVDIGCGNGRFCRSMAWRFRGSRNFLGVEINRHLVRKALSLAAGTSPTHDQDAECSGRDTREQRREHPPSNVWFIHANATTSLHALLIGYPGPINLITIQCPDPDFAASRRAQERGTAHVHRWGMLTPALVAAMLALLHPSGKILIESDIEEVATRLACDAIQWSDCQLVLCNGNVDNASDGSNGSGLLEPHVAQGCGVSKGPFTPHETLLAEVESDWEVHAKRKGRSMTPFWLQKKCNAWSIN
ncbi:unnamed protein product [Closterium sp. NIES-54]